MRQWVKWHTKVLTEPKVLRLSDRQFRVFANLIALAGYIDDAGRLGTAEDVALHLRLTERKAEASLTDLEAVGITIQLNSVWFLKNFDEYNARPPSDHKEKVRERVHKHREKEAQTEERNADVTPLHSPRNDPRIEENRVDKKRKDIGADAPTPAGPSWDELPEEKPPPKVKAPRPADPLFDAVVEVCGVDLSLEGSGSRVGKVCSALKAAVPPYTAAEVRKWGAAQGWRTSAPTVWQLKNEIGAVRKPDFGVKVNGNHKPAQRPGEAPYVKATPEQEAELRAAIKAHKAGLHANSNS